MALKDWWQNPVLAKELKAGCPIKARWLLYPIYRPLLVAILLPLFPGLMLAGEKIDHRVIYAPLPYIYLIITMISVQLGYHNIKIERRDGRLEQIFLTRLEPIEIIRGKLLGLSLMPLLWSLFFGIFYYTFTLVRFSYTHSSQQLIFYALALIVFFLYCFISGLCGIAMGLYFAMLYPQAMFLRRFIYLVVIIIIPFFVTGFSVTLASAIPRVSPLNELFISLIDYSIIELSLKLVFLTVYYRKALNFLYFSELAPLMEKEA